MSRHLPLISAFAASALSAILTLAAVPVYLSKLGTEAFGIIGFFAVIQAVLQVLDLGLAPAVNRELARATALNAHGEARTLLRTMSRVYWGMGIVLALAIFFLAPVIAKSWLGSSTLDPNAVVQALMLMGLVIGLRWPVILYQNAMIGAGHLGTASAVLAMMATLTVLSSVLAVIYIRPTLQVLFVTQACAALVHALVAQRMAWRALGGTSGAVIDFASIRRIWRFSAGMGGVALTGIALTQLDKALLSRLLPLASFGEYMLATTIVGGLAVIVTPLFNFVFPRFSALAAGGQEDRLRTLYNDGSRVFAVAFIPIAIALGVYASDVIRLWTGNAVLAERLAPIVALLCVGSTINALMYFPYSLQLARGFSWIPLVINSVLLLAFGPLILVLVLRFGAMGGAAAWALLEVIYLAFGTFMTHRHAAIGSAGAWIWRSVVVPGLLCIAIAAVLHPLLQTAPAGSVLKLFLVAVSVLFSIVVCIALHPDSRRLVLPGRPQ